MEINKGKDLIPPAPENTSSDAPVKGRRLINLLLGTGVLASIGSFLYPAFRYVIPPREAGPSSQSVDVGKVTEFKRNSGTIFKFGDKPGILIDTPSGELRAFTAVCTHLGCTVQYRADLRQIWCPCHNGHYDLHGHNVSGPPPRPLTEFDVHVENGQVIVMKKA